MSYALPSPWVAYELHLARLVAARTREQRQAESSAVQFYAELVRQWESYHACSGRIRDG